MKNINLLAIETSCDETSVAILKNGREVLANMISSQIETHKLYGGVVPEIASRLHLEAINQMLELALEEAQMTFEDLEAIAVTKGPGLVGSLLVGISAAKALSFALDIPLIGVNHMEGHIASNYIEHKNLKPPFISLVVSGGHTYLLEVKDYLEIEIIGQTFDDAAGESFDKVARSLDLPYPGGPEIDRIAKKGNSKAFNFPRAMMEEGNYNFSFSGLKTAVLNTLNSMKMKEEEIIQEDIAASFQEAVVDVLVEKSFRLLKERNGDQLAVAGGVAANSHLKERITERAKKEGIKTYFPSNILCTDNAAMIGSAGYFQYMNGKRSGLDLKVDPNLPLGN